MRDQEFRKTYASASLTNSSGQRATATSAHVNHQAREWVWQSPGESSKHTAARSGSHQAGRTKGHSWFSHCRSATRKWRLNRSMLFQLLLGTMSERPRILVVDDEPQLSRVLRT